MRIVLRRCIQSTPFPEDSIMFAPSAAVQGYLAPGEHWSGAAMPRPGSPGSDLPGRSGDLWRKSPQIVFGSAAEMLSAFGMQQGGSQYRRPVASFQRIFGATIFFGADSQSERAVVVHRARFSFMTEARIWYSHDPEQGCCREIARTG